MAIRSLLLNLAWLSIELKVSSKSFSMVQLMQTSPDGLPVVIFTEEQKLEMTSNRLVLHHYNCTFENLPDAGLNLSYRVTTTGKDEWM